MDGQRHFCFESLVYHQTIAHGGSRPILFKRVAESSGGFACNFIDFSIIAPGGDIGIHTHTEDNEEIYVVISGRGLMRLDDKEFEVGPGHAIVNRPGGTHGLKNIGEEPLKLVVVEIPVRES